MVLTKSQSKVSRLLSFASLSTLCLSLGSCSTFSRHDDEPTPTTPAPDALIDQKESRIRELETSNGTLHSRVEELEIKLKAAQSPLPLRQSFDRPLRPDAGRIAHASVASSDPEVGFVNDPLTQSFRQARILFDAEKYPEAILAFSAFLEKQPKHVLAGNAQYYLAESYFLQAEYAVAEQEFSRVVSRYDRSPLITQAYARLAECYLKQGKSEEANRVQLQIQALFPNSPAAVAEMGEAPAQTSAQSHIQSPTQQIDTPTAPEKPSLPTPKNPTFLDEPPVTAPDVGGSG